MSYLNKRFCAYCVQIFLIGGICLGTSSLFSDQIRNPHLVVDTSGNQIAVWEVTASSGDSHIYASRKPVLGSWSTPVIISNTSTEQATNPQIIVGPVGAVTVVWTYINLTEGIYSLATATYNGLSGWSSPAVLSTTNDDVIQDFELSINSLGKVVMIWGAYSVDTGNSHIWNSVLSTGSWSTTQIS